jgi:DNA invertase Pin-like site-specific DNA recombinase
MILEPEFEHSARKIGYARVSTADQKLDMQLDALNAAGCDEIFTDHGVSGAKAKRPGLDKALAALEPGNALVVFKLCRLGRSVLHLTDLLTRFKNENIHFVSLSEGINTTTPGGKLVYHIFASMAEFQRDLIRENTIHGLQAARDRGQKLGRPYALDEYAVLGAHRRIEQEGVSTADMARVLNVSHSTMKRALLRMGLEC